MFLILEFYVFKPGCCWTPEKTTRVQGSLVSPQPKREGGACVLKPTGKEVKMVKFFYDYLLEKKYFFVKC